MNKSRAKDRTRTKPSGRIVLIRDGRVLPPGSKTPRLAACGGTPRA